MRIPALKFPEKLEPFKGVILFAIILMATNLFWKYNVTGDESARVDSMVTFWGLNISAPFSWMAQHIAGVSAAILHFFGWNISLEPDNILHYTNGNSVQVIWACTGLKQAYICFCILAFSRGPWGKKLWYIPLSLVVVYLFNIFRIIFIAACIGNHPNWFHFLHLYAFKYLFYGIIFMMWVYWEEKIASQTTEVEIAKDLPPTLTQDK
jgi:exosortase/archaeosortase family protein